MENRKSLTTSENELLNNLRCTIGTPCKNTDNKENDYDPLMAYSRKLKILI